MIFDTDVLIFLQRGNRKAARLIEQTVDRDISVQTYMELLQTAQNQTQHQWIHSFLKTFHFQILPLSESIGHRASIYIEEYALSSGIRAGDALIAATAIEHNAILATANKKHFHIFHDLKLKIFLP